MSNVWIPFLVLFQFDPEKTTVMMYECFVSFQGEKGEPGMMGFPGRHGFDGDWGPVGPKGDTGPPGELK